LDRDKPFALEPQIEKINSIFGHQTLEEIFDSLRQDGSEWASTQLATLNKMVSYCGRHHNAVKITIYIYNMVILINFFVTVVSFKNNNSNNKIMFE